MKKLVATLAAVVMLAGASVMTVSAATYEVEKGDSLWSISEEFNTTVEDLVDINELDSKVIQPKQQLIIDNDTLYVVEKGDTLLKISKEHGVSVSDLKEWNDLDSSLIVVGQELEIKNAKVAKEEAVSSQPKTTNTSQQEQTGSSKEKSTESSKSNDTPEGKTITVSATAYTAKCDGCSGVTSTGVDLNANPNAKVIAVDPSVIPLGSKVYVEGYGYATAADVGGAINGNKIDVHVPSKSEAVNWGVRTVNVTIVE